jgi:hypothetical protein
MTLNNQYKKPSVSMLWKMFDDDLERVAHPRPYNDPFFLKKLLFAAAEHLQALAVKDEVTKCQFDPILHKFYDLIEAGCKPAPNQKKSFREQITLGLFFHILVVYGCPKMKASAAIHTWIFPDRVKFTGRKHDTFERYYRMYEESSDPATDYEHFEGKPDYPGAIMEYSIKPLIERYGPFKPPVPEAVEAFSQFIKEAEADKRL